MPTYKADRFSMKNAPNKRRVEDILHSCSQTKSHVLCECGPESYIHISTLVAQSGPAFDDKFNITFVEHDPKVWGLIDEGIKKKLRYRKDLKGRIHHHKGDILDAPLINGSYYRFIDADFMRAIASTKETYVKLLRRQAKFDFKNLSLRKTMIGTNTIRQSCEDELMDFFKGFVLILGAKLVGFDGMPDGWGKGSRIDAKRGPGANHLKEHWPKWEDGIMGRVKNFRMFIYGDSTPMITWIIEYV